MDMHMQMQLPEPRYRGLCKILLLVCAALMIAFFITGFLNYFDYQAGETVTVRGVEYTAEETESFSLMSYLGFPDSYEFLKGFISGIHAGNYDITHFFIDNFFKLVDDKSEGSLVGFIQWLAAYSDKENIEFVISISMDPETAPDVLKQYMI